MLFDYEELHIREVSVPNELLRRFEDKIFVQEYLLDAVEYQENTFHIPALNELQLATTIFHQSNQRRQLPFGFRVIDYEMEYTPLGRCIVGISVKKIFRMGKDRRNDSELIVTKAMFHFIYNSKSTRWILVDLENKNHESTIAYFEREDKEFDLSEEYRKKYFKYYDEGFLRMLESEVIYQTLSSVKEYILKFTKLYFPLAISGLEAYRFFDTISPTEFHYLRKYIDYLQERVEKIIPYFATIQNDELNKMVLEEKESFAEIMGAANLIRSFFQPRSEKPNPRSLYGYEPTQYFKRELKHELIPNAAEIERRFAYNSDNFFWSDNEEKKLVNELKEFVFSSPKNRV